MMYHETHFVFYPQTLDKGISNTFGGNQVGKALSSIKVKVTDLGITERGFISGVSMPNMKSRFKSNDEG